MIVTIYFEPNGAPIRLDDVETTNNYDKVLTVRFKSGAPLHECEFNWDRVAYIEKEFSPVQENKNEG
jgi:hypothetical protein